MKHKHFGFTVVEIVIVLVVISGVGFGLYQIIEGSGSDSSQNSQTDQNAIDESEDILVPLSEPLVPVDLERDPFDQSSDEDSNESDSSMDDIFGDPAEPAPAEPAPAPTEESIDDLF